MAERLTIEKDGGVTTEIVSSDNYGMVTSTKNLCLAASSGYKLELWGEAVQLGPNGPTITWGKAPAPGSPSEYKPGSLHVSEGGSLWITNSNKQWTRVQ